MDNNLIKKLQEEELFKAPNSAEIAHRKATRPRFVCPLYKQKVVVLLARPEQAPYRVPVTPDGEVDLDDLDQSEGYDRNINTDWIFNCPSCNGDVTKYISCEEGHN